MTSGDKEFLRIVMGQLGIKAIAIDESGSKRVHPDLWVLPNERPPRIVVTREWARQNVHERRKRLVHEICHLLGLRHPPNSGVWIDGYYYSTYPEEDDYSRMVYRKLVKK